jgi:uncharacterized damage-inducible protein DinB
MPRASSLLPEFDYEAAVTRRLLERVPADQVHFRPHPKSFALGDLSLHIVNLLTWFKVTVQQDELDLHPPGGEPWKSAPYESPAATLRKFDTDAAAARAILAAMPDEAFDVPWTLKYQGQTIFSLPRGRALRTYVLNHQVHHRGQLSVYLRMCGVPLPEMYGPTADSQG